MPFENWQVETEVPVLPKPDIRKVYADLLREMIVAIEQHEPETTVMPELRGPTFALPAIFFPCIVKSPTKDVYDFKMLCFRSVDQFLVYFEGMPFP